MKTPEDIQFQSELMVDACVSNFIFQKWFWRWKPFQLYCYISLFQSQFQSLKIDSALVTNNESDTVLVTCSLFLLAFTVLSFLTSFSFSFPLSHHSGTPKPTRTIETFINLCLCLHVANVISTVSRRKEMSLWWLSRELDSHGQRNRGRVAKMGHIEWQWIWS